MSRDHGVKTDYVDQTLARRQLSQLHIVAVLGEFEQFLEDLRASHPDRLSWTYNKDKKEALLVRIIRNLSPSTPAARTRLGDHVVVHCRSKELSARSGAPNEPPRLLRLSQMGYRLRS